MPSTACQLASQERSGFVLLLIVGVTMFSGSASAQNPCDLNNDGTVNGADALLAVNMDIGLSTCTANIVAPGICNVVVVQRVINAALGGPCVSSGQGMPGPLVASPNNSRYFQDKNGKIVFLSGSQTWRTGQDTSTAPDPVLSDPLDFTVYVNFLKAHGHTATIIWHKDLPTLCNWGAGGTWNMAPWQWQRTGPGNASDGQPKFDLTKFNQAFFDRIRTRVGQLNQNGIWAIVEFFDGLGLHANRCAADGFPFSSVNNINSVADDGAESSMTMTTNNTISNYQDAYVKKMIDTLNDMPNVIWEISEEAPSGSGTWWSGHMIGLIHAYEAGGTFESVTYPAKALQHPVLYPTLQPLSDDTGLKNSKADAIAPGAKFFSSSGSGNCGSTGTPLCKVVINDSDHNYFGMWNDSAQTNRQFFW
jgi:hypothetical protein